MFRDSLLESSPAAHKHKRWPMATAFTLEMIVAAMVVIVPLLSTGVIPLSAHIILTPPKELSRLEPPKHKPEPDHSGPRHGAPALPEPTEVVLISDNRDAPHIGKPIPTTTDPTVPPGPMNDPGKGLPDDLVRHGNGDNGAVVKPGSRRIVSVLSEAQLLTRVEPVYPRIAVVTGIQGQVKLHAIIARDGQVVSLNAISGHPLLVRAAIDAVSQWRYRPYYLNGEAVEVETSITVNFKREGR